MQPLALIAADILGAAWRYRRLARGVIARSGTTFATSACRLASQDSSKKRE
ncbi:hypothetical protein [Psychrobacter jeotgali]|uniref:hypothetical protein n=1 Tax=Psychrobacter jeotgali TaxID=179010 RepID=UPI0019186E88|nr:hypothetical protein [Psychrobacter jeotgali]